MRNRAAKIVRNIRLISTCVSLASAATAFASPITLTFDDLLGWPWPNPYNGLTWNNFLPENVPTIIAEGFTPSGYQVGLISSPNVVYNSGGNPASIIRSGGFDFDSAFMTAAIMDNLQLEVKGYLNGNLKYDNTWTLRATSPTFITFNYYDVDTVNLITSGGTLYYSNFYPGEQFAMDNLTVNLTPTIIPEPRFVALWLFGASIVFLGLRKSRFAKKSQ